MKFFKKKKSDKDLSEQSTPYNLPLTATSEKNTLTPADILEAPVRTMPSPILVMPKPRKFLTPTRAILGRFDRDKTQIEDDGEIDVNEANVIYPQEISPILKPATETDDTILFLKNKSFDDVEETSYALASLSLGDAKLKKLPNIPKVKKKLIQQANQEQKNYYPQTLYTQTTQQEPLADSIFAPHFYNHKEIQKVKEPTYNMQQEITKQNEQDQVLQALKKQIEFMEQQRIKDREEWKRKEQELLDKRQKMMETLQQTKEQLDQVLRDREEVYKQQQLQQQLFHQAQMQLGEKLMSPRQSPIPQLEEEVPRRMVNKSRSEEHLRTRSSSRSSHYEKSISRKSSSASTKSGFCQPSPSSTLVPTPHYHQKRRSRARSIDWHDEQMMMDFMDEPRMYAKSPYQQDGYYNDEEIEDMYEEGFYMSQRSRRQPDLPYYNHSKWQPPPVYYQPRPPADYRRGYGGHSRQPYLYN